MRFQMTTDGTVKWITALTGAVVLVTSLVPLALFSLPHVPAPVAWLTFLVTLGVPAILGFTVLLAPRGVRVEHDTLIVERLAWSDVRIPLADITSAEVGPQLALMGGGAWRFAGNGGLMGFTGFFKVRKTGEVARCWSSRLGGTVLLHRSDARPVLLGVDDGAGLLQALHERGATGRPAST
ncbi:MAG: PH domain-containing protein [Myxococcales bacterium]|nr:PH domain-containing protein [Myxococcales bacterium]